MPFRSFFGGKRVLVTGDTGFKGSWLCEWLLLLGADVYGIGLEPETDPSLFRVLELGNRIDHETIDIRNADTLTRAVRRIAPDVVFHLAAQALVRRSYDIPLETIETNVTGTANVLSATQASAIERDAPVAIVLITSDKCYENRDVRRTFVESDPMGGDDLYSASKGAAEIVAAAWRRSFFAGSQITMATCRAGNVIGGGDWALDRVVPDAVRALSREESIMIRNPESVRPWQHVLEPLSGYLHVASLLGDDPTVSTAWNFGPASDSERTVGELADFVVETWGGGMWHTEDRGDQPHEAKFLHLSIEKAERGLNWRPIWAFAETIAMTVDWYRNAIDGNPVTYTQAQIEAYQSAAAMNDVAWAVL